MSVQKRKTSRGETLEYHYKFMSGGKYFYGVCVGCSTKKAAEEYEAKLKKKVKDLAKQKTVKALVENFREELTGGSRITLTEAYNLSLKKPRKRQPSSELIDIKRSYWRDFVFFMQVEYPDITGIADVRKCHAEAYIQYLREHGRFEKTVHSTVNKKCSKGNLAPKTINTFQQTLTEVFEKLSHDAGLIENPFEGIVKLNNASESREAFSMEELELIRNNWTPFIKPIFILGSTTALREGDLCTLRWKEIDFRREIIIRKMLKTGATVEIPIMPPLKIFLLEQQQKTGNDEYVLPEHAAMYYNNSTGISYRVKNFLEGLGIKTTKRLPGRSRAISIKDVHSLRHTFCYYAGYHGIPMNIVQSIVGHMTSELTKHYQAHADRKAKREKMKLMPDIMGLLSDGVVSLEISEISERELLKQLVETANITDVRKCIRLLRK